MHFVFVSSILTLSRISSYPAAPAPWPSPEPFIRRNNETYSSVGCSKAETLTSIRETFSLFSRQIISSLAKRKRDVFVTSPIAVAIAMSLVTSAPTEQDASSDATECLKKMGLQAFIDDLHGYAGSGLEIAGSVFVSPKVDLHAEFIQTVTKTFRTPLRQLDFEEPSARENFATAWADGNTETLMNAYTSMAHVSAIYYKGEWDKFNPHETFNVSSHVEGQEIIPISSTMYMRGSFLRGFYPKMKSDFVVIPLKKEDGQKQISLLYIKPEDGSGDDPFFEVTDDMSEMNIRELLSYGRTSVEYTGVPRFKIESIIDLRAAVDSITPQVSIFDQSRKLKPIAKSPHILGDKLVQRASILINEEGIVATMIDNSADPPPAGPTEFGGYQANPSYVLLLAMGDTLQVEPQIIFAVRIYN